MIFRNFTPHAINIHHDGGIISVGPDGPAPRLAVNRQNLGNIGGINMVRSTMGSPAGLPDQQDGVILIVSALVAEHPDLSDRCDLAYPGEAIRDDAGRIVGCRGLCAGPGLAAVMAAAAM